MTFSIGPSGLAFSHLLTRVLFNALLLMCGGFFIHSTVDLQDIFFMGGLSVYTTFTSSI
jgi:NADH:ubiquinone oxidoreductase subunit 5 (subunit L)/multisubunit Na+/H+ antiporter MnhA subunit